MTNEKWWWWAGDAGTVDAEGIYEHGECDTRDEVIARILPEIDEGTVFIVIEAQFDQRPLQPGEHEEDFRPFAATRNQQFLIKRNGTAEIAPPEEPPLKGWTPCTQCCAAGQDCPACGGKGSIPPAGSAERAALDAEID